jgi:putative lipoic acid-binding regulatory protein
MTGEGLPQFPCSLPIKVFGRNDPAFRTAALAIVRAYYAEHDVAERPSRQGTYLSLTITVRAQSKAQIDAVYQALVASDDVLMVL